ncbi:hypothetical protein CCY16_00159 [Wolbachia endosymbiont of Wuchereria bancrofti]|nr:hypothetical protein CCY16_00159 [Wolbachia endosymbiont of Wuchereria bancrofti]
MRLRGLLKSTRQSVSFQKVLIEWQKGMMKTEKIQHDLVYQEAIHLVL